MTANPYDLTSRELLSILFKEKGRLATIFLGLFALVLAASYLLTPHYEAQARLLVKSGPEFETRAQAGQSVASVPYATKQEIVNSEMQILTSRDLVEQVVNAIGVSKLYPDLAASGAGDRRSMDAAVRRFGSDFSATPVVQSDVIDLAYRNPDREMAVQALRLTLDLYQQKHGQMFSDRSYQTLDQQTKDYQAQLEAVTRRETELRTSQSLFDVDAQRARLLDDRAALAATLQQLRSQLIDARQRASFLQKRLGATPALISGGGSNVAGAVEAARQQLLVLQMREQQLGERYAVDLPPVRDARQEIAALRRFITANEAGSRQQITQRNPAYDELTVSLNRALADAAPLDGQIALRSRQIDEDDLRLRALANGETALQALERERKVLDELLHTYRTRYEDARMEADQKSVSVSVIQQAGAPDRPAGPSHLLFALAGIALGLLAAGGMLLYLLVFRATLITVESVERLVGLPVLASVPVQ